MGETVVVYLLQLREGRPGLNILIGKAVNPTVGVPRTNYSTTCNELAFQRAIWALLWGIICYMMDIHYLALKCTQRGDESFVFLLPSLESNSLDNLDINYPGSYLGDELILFSNYIFIEEFVKQVSSRTSTLIQCLCFVHDAENIYKFPFFTLNKLIAQHRHLKRLTEFP